MLVLLWYVISSFSGSNVLMCRMQFSRRHKAGNPEVTLSSQNFTGLQAPDRPSDKDNHIGPLGLNLLYTSSVPLIDFIFVHGLRGGSRKTWSKSSDPCHFWPKEWLPKDADFKNARIHSFGYSSDWASMKESVLNIHDFGKSLLAEILNSPEIKGDGDVG